MINNEMLRQYRALGALPGLPGEREWVDRICTEELLIRRGAEVARALRDTQDPVESMRLRELCPALYDLLLGAF